MNMGIWRSIGGVARQVVNQWRDVSGVDRSIKAEWRGVSGIARQVFGDNGLVLYDYGYNPYNFHLSNTNSPVASIETDRLAVVEGRSYYESDMAPFRTDVVGDAPATLDDYKYVKIIASESFFHMNNWLILRCGTTNTLGKHGRIPFSYSEFDGEDETSAIQTRYAEITSTDKTNYASYFTEYGDLNFYFQIYDYEDQQEVGDNLEFYYAEFVDVDIYHLSLVADKD